MSFQQMVLQQLHIRLQTNEIGTLLHTIYKNQLNVDQRPKCKT